MDSSTFTPVVFFPTTSSKGAKRNCQCGKNQCARVVFRTELIVSRCCSQQRKISWSCHKITLAFIAARLALAVLSPFVKQMQTRSWARCRLRLLLVVARMSLSQSVTCKNRKNIYIYTVYDYLQIVRPLKENVIPFSFLPVTYGEEIILHIWRYHIVLMLRGMRSRFDSAMAIFGVTSFSKGLIKW